MVELFLAAPPSSARITQRRHPEHSSALTQHRQDLATPQQLLRAFLAFKLLLMIMGDIHRNQSKHGFFFFYFGSIKEEMQVVVLLNLGVCSLREQSSCWELW